MSGVGVGGRGQSLYLEGQCDLMSTPMPITGISLIITPGMPIIDPNRRPLLTLGANRYTCQVHMDLQVYGVGLSATSECLPRRTQTSGGI